MSTADRRRLLLCALVLSPLAPVVVAAQSQLDPHPGDRVRLRTTHGFTIGSLIALTDDSVVIVERQNGQTVQRTYRTHSLRSFEVRRGRHGHPVSGFFIGALVGAVAGPAIGKASCAAGDSWCFGSEYGLLIGPPTGALLGSITGALIRTERWTRVKRAPVRVSVAPARGGNGLGVSLSF
jgi:hypothetical protein